MKKFLLMTVISTTLYSCQKDLAVLPELAKQKSIAVTKAPAFDASDWIKLTPSEIIEGREYEQRSPYALKKVDWFLENTFSDFAAGNWTVNLPSGKQNTNYGWWMQYETNVGWADSNVVILHHINPRQPELNGAVAIALFQDRPVDEDGNEIVNTTGIINGQWEIIAVASSGIYSRYTRGGGPYTYTYSPKEPTGYYEDGTPIDPLRRTITITGRIRY